MERLQIHPVCDSALPEVAQFLQRQTDTAVTTGPERGSSHEDYFAIEARLRWLLLDNPVRDASHHGLCVRDVSGRIVGLTLSFPGAFLAGDQRILGLGSGGFFVEPKARSAGFYLFKNYLNTRGHSFFYTTTSNANSAPLWSRLGGCPLPNSEFEYLLPIRLDTLLPALVGGKVGNPALAALAQNLGRLAGPIWQWRQKRYTAITFTPCRDFEKLAALFHRHRLKDSITTERSADYLAWRYGQNTEPEPAGLYLFRDQCRNEGWFALGRANRGRHGQIRSAVLLDTVWPRDKMHFKDILPAILQVVARDVDALFLRPRAGVDYRECGGSIVRFGKGAPGVFAIPRKGYAGLPLSSLDLVPADGDSALPVGPPGRVRTEADLASTSKSLESLVARNE